MCVLLIFVCENSAVMPGLEPWVLSVVTSGMVESVVLEVVELCSVACTGWTWSSVGVTSGHSDDSVSSVGSEGGGVLV